MTRAQFSAVLFDMDGVLLQSRQVIERAWTSVARAYGITLTEACIQAHIHGRPGSYTLDALFGRVSEAERQAIKQRVDAEEETAPCALVPGVAELLDALRHARVPLALVTSSWPARIGYVLRQHDLRSAFATVISRDDVALGKPHPDSYLLAARRLEVPIAECLVFEDSESGVKAAVQSGALCVGIGGDPTLLRHGARAIYQDFRGLIPQFADVPSHYVELHEPAALVVVKSARP
ncbi:HAD family phosphatase [Sorangium sp. So ce834]|uniref:HAD family hydrolase n=1 Tax=Sorangium sp. So ce834 TaxID=3133321 RepID=UPI003F644A55